MPGEQYQPDVLHPAWAPGAVAPLPSYSPADYVQYTLQYADVGTNGDFFTPTQPRVRACAPTCVGLRRRACNGGSPSGRRAGTSMLSGFTLPPSALPPCSSDAPRPVSSQVLAGSQPRPAGTQGGVGGSPCCWVCGTCAARTLPQPQPQPSPLPAPTRPPGSLTVAPCPSCSTPSGSTTTHTWAPPACPGFTTASTSPPAPTLASAPGTPALDGGGFSGLCPACPAGHALLPAIRPPTRSSDPSPRCRSHARRLVVRTPHGWAMPPFMRPLFQPLLRQPVTTFAE